MSLEPNKASDGGADPTMEEILASIRRIIAEENDPASGLKAKDDAAASQAGAASVPEAAPKAPDVLDLTEMVADDGSVVSLPGRADFSKIEPPVVPGPEPAAQEQATQEPAEDAGPPEALVAPEPVSPDDIDFAPVDAAAEPAAPPEAAAEAAVDPVAAPDLEATLTPPIPLDDEFDMAEHAPGPAKEAAAETDNPQLVSGETASLARAAFAQVNQAVQTEQIARSFLANSRAIEQMAEDLLKPLLKEWLEANLAAIVERIVSEEVARIAGRPS